MIGKRRSRRLGRQDSVSRSQEANAQLHVVFADPSGRRWRRWRVSLVVVLGLIFLVAGVLLPQAYRTPRPVPTQAAPLSIRDVGHRAPVVGAGPLTRVLRIDRSQGFVGVDPYSRARLTTFDQASAAQIGTADYVIEKYGYAQGVRRTLALTFDDGPDPEHTPKLLDLLAKEQVPATFFLVGRYMVQHPQIVQRMVREGHSVGLHTVSHPDVANLPDWRQQAELSGNERILRAIAGVGSTYWRMPYTDPTTANVQATVDGLLRGQQLGYTHASYDFDTFDWLHNNNPDESAADIPLPDLTRGTNLTVLLHDAGGPNRQRTIEYTANLIAKARQQGYTFHTMPQVNPALSDANPAAGDAQLGDAVVMALAGATFTWPVPVMWALFVLALVGIGIYGWGGALLALIRRRRQRGMVWPEASQVTIDVAVALAAYNEEAVIGRTLRSVLASSYPLAEVVVVDDGSTDATADIVRSIAAQDPRVRLIIQPNAGKAKALNRAVADTAGEVVVTLDADTIITPDTIPNLVRHFALDSQRRLGAVAGVIRVGNRRTNLLTRWQALEYVTQIGVERAAQDGLGAISIIPGACAAWRREAILAAGGYSTDTLAEDCDLALTLHRLGWRITQDDEALAYTEAPETVDDLLKQRTRWTFGTMQAMAKHRGLMFRRGQGMLGWFVMPHFAVSVLLPLLTMPFVAMVTVMTLQQGGASILAAYFGLFLLTHLVVAVVAVGLLREDWRVLVILPIYRLIYEPLRAYLLYSCAAAALKGRRMGWNKVHRTGTVEGHEAHPQPRRPDVERPNAGRPAPSTVRVGVPTRVAATSRPAFHGRPTAARRVTASRGTSRPGESR